MKSLLDAMAMNHCKLVATLGSNGQENSHVATENWILRNIESSDQVMESVRK